MLLLLLAALTIPAAPGWAHSNQPAAAQPDVGVQADFNQDGFADLAVGVPFEDVGNIGSAGAVNVLYGSAGGLSGSGGQLFTQVGSAVEPGDFFGFALASGDFNNDGFADLAAAAPFENVGNIEAGGAVSILNGSASGLTTSGARLFTQVGSAVEPDDSFGFALASGDFNNDGFADLAAAAPAENVGNIEAGGAVSVLSGSAAGLTTSGGRLFTQDSPGVPGVTEPFDFFGAALAADVLGAAPAQASASVSGSAAQRVSQGS